jgi:nickel/cobalt exporter
MPHKEVEMSYLPKEPHQHQTCHHNTSQTLKYDRVRGNRGRLMIFTVVLLIAGYWLWSEWPTLFMISVQWQKKIMSQLSDLLYTAKHSHSAMLVLLEVSFFYGIFHSLGPGHGKVVVSTYLATHQTKIKAGLLITIISAFVQALTAIILVSLFLFIFRATMHQLNNTMTQFFHASYVGVSLLGLYIVIQSLHRLYVHRHHDSNDSHDTNHHHHEDQHHEHITTCSCGHRHIADANELNRASNFKEYAAIVFSIGLRPCTGALLILFFSHLAQVYWIGILSTLLMSVGTAFTTSTIALLTVSGRKIIRHYMVSPTTKHEGVWLSLRVTAGMVLILFSLLMMGQNTFGMSSMLTLN